MKPGARETPGEGTRDERFLAFGAVPSAQEGNAPGKEQKGARKMKKDGGWIFLSHSHLDVEVVRRIRNLLESRGFEPLMFYLKCLSDEDEIESLIQREIDARDWFIYVESPNAQQSRWVQSERRYIASKPGKKVFTIDAMGNLQDQVVHIARQLKVFISGSHRDEALVSRIRERLLDNDLLVFDPEDITPDVAAADWTKAAIDASAREGFVLLLVTEQSAASAWVQQEIAYSVECGSRIVPVYVGNASLNPALLDRIGEIQGVHLDEDPSDEQLDQLVEQILERVDYYDSDFTMSCGFQSARSIEYPSVAAIPDYTFWDCFALESVRIPPSVIYISDKAFREDQDVLILCEKGSAAEKFCLAQGRRYRII